MSVEEVLVRAFARRDARIICRRRRRPTTVAAAAAAAAAMETAGRIRRVAAGHGAAAGSGNKKVREKPLVSSAEIYGSRRVDGNLKF